jgi:hypothetical protein
MQLSQKIHNPIGLNLSTVSNGQNLNGIWDLICSLLLPRCVRVPHGFLCLIIFSCTQGRQEQGRVHVVVGGVECGWRRLREHLYPRIDL